MTHPTPVHHGHHWSWWRARPLEWVDPHRLHLFDTPVRPDLVAAYAADPDRPSPDGNDPCVARCRDGTLQVVDGKHRALAARRTGRLLRARVADE